MPSLAAAVPRLLEGLGTPMSSECRPRSFVFAVAEQGVPGSRPITDVPAVENEAVLSRLPAEIR